MGSKEEDTVAVGHVSRCPCRHHTSGRCRCACHDYRYPGVLRSKGETLSAGVCFQASHIDTVTMMVTDSCLLLT